MIYVNIILIVVLATAGAWWLSGYDPRLSGQDTPADQRRRFIRTALSVLLVVLICLLPMEQTSWIAAVFLSFLLAAVWISPATEFLAHMFHKMIGMGATNRPHDPTESLRNADAMAALLREGRNDEALQMYENLKASNDANIMVIETLLHRANIPYQRNKRPQPLLDARNLRQKGQFTDAEIILKMVLEERPDNMDAAMMLLRLYVHDLRDRNKAVEVLRKLIHQPHVPAANIEYAQRLIHEFNEEKVAPELEPLPETVEGLLAAGYFGTAIEMLEQKAAEQPENFDAQLRLIEARALHSRDFATAKRMIKDMETRKAFPADQIATAKAKLEEWHTAKPQR